MAILKIKDEHGNFIGIPSIKGENGKDGKDGVSDYNGLTSKPSINNIELTGNKTLDELNIQPKGNYLTSIPSEYITENELNNKGYITGYTESDPTVPSHVKNITQENINYWNDKQSNIITVACDDGNIEKTISTSWTQVKVNLAKLKNKLGDCFELDSTNGCILVKSGVTNALVSMSFMVRGISGYVEMGFRVKRNGAYLTTDPIAAYSTPNSATAFASASISPTLLSLQENDQIEIYLSSSAAGTITISGSKYTRVTIQKV